MSQADPSTLQSLIYEVRDKVAYVTINRPTKMNALNRAVLRELALVTTWAEENLDVMCFVLRGAGGKAFSAGVDLKMFHEEGTIDDVGAHLLFTAQLRDTLIKVEQTPLPVIAAIEGFALAGGLELALTADFILCTDTCQIGDQHANYGLMAGGGGTQRLPRKIGVQRGLELLYTAKRLNGPQAVAYGLALRSYPVDQFDAGIEDLVGQLRTKSRIGFGYVKKTVARGMELPLRDALDLERLAVQEYFSCHSEAGQGVTDFNSKKRSSDL